MTLQLLTLFITRIIFYLHYDTVIYQLYFGWNSFSFNSQKLVNIGIRSISTFHDRSFRDDTSTYSLQQVSVIKSWYIVSSPQHVLGPTFFSTVASTIMYFAEPTVFLVAAGEVFDWGRGDKMNATSRNKIIAVIR